MLVRYYGHVGGASGYGQAANETCMAILEAGLELEISTDGKQLRHPHLPLSRCIRHERALSPNPDAVIVHTLPIGSGALLAKVTADRTRDGLGPWGCPLIAYTTWEGSSPVSAAIDGALAGFSDIWVPSKVTARWFQATMAGAQRVSVVPHAYDMSMAGRTHVACPSCGDFHVLGEYRPGDVVVTPDGPGVVQEWGHLGGPLWVRVTLDGGRRADYHPCQFQAKPRVTPYRFYYVGAWIFRKNVEGVIKAYMRNFSPHDNVELVIHAAGAGESACNIAQLATGLALEQMPKIKFINQRVSDEAIREVHRQGDCYVTASRGEAWNIPAFDAMMAGKHVIAPQDMGSDEFLMGTSADLYRGMLVPAGGEVVLWSNPMAPSGHVSATYIGNEGLTVRSDWMEPDISLLGKLMRQAYVENNTSLRVTYDPASRYGRPAVGARIKSLLEGAMSDHAR